MKTKPKSPARSDILCDVMDHNSFKYGFNL